MSAPSAIAARTDPYRDNRPERVYEVRYLDTTPLTCSAAHAAGAPANPPAQEKSPAWASSRR